MQYCLIMFTFLCQKYINLLFCQSTIGPLSVCLSVMLVYCGQTVDWIKMPLGMDVGLGLGHILLEADAAPPP